MKQDQTPATVSADRTLEAHKWLRDYISTHSPRSSPSLPTATATTTTALEAVRAHLSSREALAQAATTNIQKRTATIQAETTAWRMAGVSTLLSAFQPDAIDETTQLATLCAALGLSAADAANPHSRAMAAAAAARDERLTMRRGALRRAALARAQMALRDAARAQAYGMDMAVRATEDAEKRQVATVQEQRRAETLEEKTGQYERAVAEALWRAEAAGVDGVKHDEVAERGRRVQDKLRELQDVREELAKFHGLPAVGFPHCICFFRARRRKKLRMGGHVGN